ncbi:MAG: LLM class flavin-dependent oxidoreductase [Novosphingobium sp.]
MVALSAIAARTSRIRLGSAIALAPLYNPVRFAEDCAVLDILADGRLDMGLAIGYRRRETAAFGVDFTRRGRIFDEWLEIVTRLWAGETVDFSGKHFSVAGAKVMPPAPRGRIPLFIGGFAEKAMSRVARYGEGYIGSRDVCGLYIDKLRSTGRDPASARIRTTELFLAIAEDPEQAMDELAPYYHHVNNGYGEFFNEDQALGMGGPEPQSLEEYKASGALQIWTPDEAIERFRAMQEEMPLEHVMMMMPPGLPASRFVEYAEVVARKVIPAFQ